MNQALFHLHIDIRYRVFNWFVKLLLWETLFIDGWKILILLRCLRQPLGFSSIWIESIFSLMYPNPHPILLWWKLLSKLRLWRLIPKILVISLSCSLVLNLETLGTSNTYTLRNFSNWLRGIICRDFAHIYRMRFLIVLMTLITHLMRGFLTGRSYLSMWWWTTTINTTTNRVWLIDIGIVFYHILWRVLFLQHLLLILLSRAHSDPHLLIWRELLLTLTWLLLNDMLCYVTIEHWSFESHLLLMLISVAGKGIWIFHF